MASRFSCLAGKCSHIHFVWVPLAVLCPSGSLACCSGSTHAQTHTHRTTRTPSTFQNGRPFNACVCTPQLSIPPSRRSPEKAGEYAKEFRERWFTADGVGANISSSKECSPVFSGFASFCSGFFSAISAESPNTQPPLPLPLPQPKD